MHRTLSTWLGALPLALSAAVPKVIPRFPQAVGYSNSTNICDALNSQFPGQVTRSGDTVYTTETTNYWSFRSMLDPFCVFGPETSQSLAEAVTMLADSNTRFAIRSGGHSPVMGAAGITDGVLIVTTHLNEMTVVSSSEEYGVPYFRMGAGRRWGEVYEFLGPQGLNVVGGRVYPVGTSVLLGGGISYLGGRHGWASGNVVNYELVTGTGEVLQVNQNSHPDLYWALKGGSNNYGIVTRYDLRTVPQDNIWGGAINYGPEHAEDFIDAYQAWVNPGGGFENPDAAIMPNVNYNPATGQTLASFTGMRNDPGDNPPEFANFTSIPSQNSTVGVKSYNDFVQESRIYAGPIARGAWFATGVSFFNETISFQVNTMRDTADELLAGLDVVIGMANEPITVDFLERSRDNGGDPMDLDPARGNFHVSLIFAFWLDESLDDRMINFLQRHIENIDAGARERGVHYPFIWLNNAGETQDPIGTYGYGNSVGRMREVAERYDPEGVFQRLVPGFKLGGPRFFD